MKRRARRAAADVLCSFHNPTTLGTKRHLVFVTMLRVCVYSSAVFSWGLHRLARRSSLPAPPRRAAPAPPPPPPPTCPCLCPSAWRAARPAPCPPPSTPPAPRSPPASTTQSPAPEASHGRLSAARLHRRTRGRTSIASSTCSGPTVFFLPFSHSSFASDDSRLTNSAPQRTWTGTRQRVSPPRQPRHARPHRACAAVGEHVAHFGGQLQVRGQRLCKQLVDGGCEARGAQQLSAFAHASQCAAPC